MNNKEYLKKLSPLKNKKILVIGGCGFLGSNIIKMLIDSNAHPIIFDINIKNNKIKNSNLELIEGNILNYEDINNACKGVYGVIHCASPSPLSNNTNLIYKINVNGTENVIKACKQHNITKLIYTSTASIIYNGKDQLFLNETTPPPKHIFSNYANSKKIAEELILKASTNNLATCAIRPHSIFGPGDNSFMPNLLLSASKGKNKFMIGSGSNLVNFTYVDNVSFAHLLAMTKLEKNSPLDSSAYFITNKEIVPLWDFIGNIYESLGYQRPYIKIPTTFMHMIVSIKEMLARISKLFEIKGGITREVVCYVSTHHFYDCNKATREFGYFPIVSLKEGHKKNIEYFSNLKIKSKNDYKKKGYFYSITVFIIMIYLIYKYY